MAGVVSPGVYRCSIQESGCVSSGIVPTSSSRGLVVDNKHCNSGQVLLVNYADPSVYKDCNAGKNYVYPSVSRFPQEYVNDHISLIGSRSPQEHVPENMSFSVSRGLAGVSPILQGVFASPSFSFQE